MTMITIYGIQSAYAFRVRAALLQKGLPFQHVGVSLANKSEEFTRLTPIETIPVVQDSNGTVLCDSLHALDYFDRQYPDTYPMLGRNSTERVKILTVIAAVDKIMSFFGPYYNERPGRVQQLCDQQRSHRALQYNQQQKQDLRQEIFYRLGKLTVLLDGKTFFTSQFSAADAAMLTLLRYIASFGEAIPSSWEEWMQKLLQDEKIVRMFPAADEKGVRDI